MCFVMDGVPRPVVSLFFDVVRLHRLCWIGPIKAQILARGSARLSDVAEPFPMSLTGFCKHVRVLERAGLVRRTRRGRSKILELSPEPLRDVAQWVLKYQPFWNARLDRLQEFFAKQKQKSR